MADSDYSIAEIQGHVPENKVVNGILYCDGIKIERWQLTDEEIARFFPGDKRGKRVCPFEGCAYEFTETKMSWMHHVRLAHREWYELHKERFLACPSLNDFRNMFIETQGKAVPSGNE